MWPFTDWGWKTYTSATTVGAGVAAYQYMPWKEILNTIIKNSLDWVGDQIGFAIPNINEASVMQKALDTFDNIVVPALNTGKKLQLGATGVYTVSFFNILGGVITGFGGEYYLERKKQFSYTRAIFYSLATYAAIEAIQSTAFWGGGMDFVGSKLDQVHVDQDSLRDTLVEAIEDLKLPQ